MSDGSLSQDEIDALLQGSGGMDFDGPSGGGGSAGIDTSGIEAVLRQTVESQKSNLSMLVSKNVDMSLSSVSAGDASSLGFQGQVVHITQGFTDGLDGDHGYIMEENAAIQIAGPIMGQEGVEINDAAVSALQEAFSQISGPVLTSLGDEVGGTVMAEPPGGGSQSVESLSVPGSFVQAQYSVSIDGESPVTVIEYFGPEVAQRLSQSSQPAAQSGGQQANPFGGGGGGQEDPFAGLAGMGNMGGGQQGGNMQQGMGNMMGGGPSVQSVQFPNLQQGPSSQEQGNIGLLMDVYMEMTVELGRTRKLIKEILGMGEGTIIELDKLAGEPVDILVNHKLIAKGEVVVIDENFGVRVTEIVSPMERVSNMT